MRRIWRRVAGRSGAADGRELLEGHQMAKTLGFVGLGAMGGRVTKRLLDAGHTVVGYNRTHAKAEWLLAAGMRWGESPRAVAEAADVIFSMVTNTAALEAVVEGPDGILA